MTPRAFGLWFTLGAWLMAPDVTAHVLGISNGHYEPSAGGLRAELTFASAELAPTESMSDPQRWIDAIEVSRTGTRCPGQLLRDQTDADKRVLTLQFSCPNTAPRTRVQLGFWSELEPGHRHVASAGSTVALSQAVSYAAQPSFELLDRGAEAANSANSQTRPDLGAWLRHGVEHILTGYDHLLFLAALLLGVRKLRALALISSMFTLGHSVTLALSAWGPWAPPAAIIEPLIALSICYVAVENLHAARPRVRPWLALGFGFIHGFGFAGALRGSGLEVSGNLYALGAFNLGVELGQIAVVAVTWPLLCWLERAARRVPSAFVFANILVGLLGLSWFSERVWDGLATPLQNAGTGAPLAAASGESLHTAQTLSARDSR